MPVAERVEKEFHRSIQEDMNELFLGQRLGGGATREVFVDRLHPNRVVKIEENGFQNVTEYLVWAAVCDTLLAPWFARCFYLSPNGRVLIQRRTYLPNRRPPLPELVPSFLADARECNMGVIGKRWVFHDYGYTNLIRSGLNNITWKPLQADHDGRVKEIDVEVKEWTLP